MIPSITCVCDSSASTLHGVPASPSTIPRSSLGNRFSRDADRSQLRGLLDQSILKMHAGNLPLRKSLLVYSTIKSIQRELEVLDDEDVYGSLFEGDDSMDFSPSTPASPLPRTDETKLWEPSDWSLPVSPSHEHISTQNVLGGSCSSAALDWTGCESWLFSPSSSAFDWSLPDATSSWNPLGQNALSARELLALVPQQPLEVLMQA